jgi:uncharacterized protein (DUF1330 family)
MPAYFVVNTAIKDMDLLNEYQSGAGASMGLVPIKPLAVDNDSEVLEGGGGRRTVILEFASKEDFRTWYESPEYQAVIGKRLAATDGIAVLANGF